MKGLILGLFLAASALQADQAITLTVTITDTHVWALTQDYVDYQNAGLDTNGITTNTLTKLQWFIKNSTNQILQAADRRVKIRQQELLSRITEIWPGLTPAQQSNIINSLPPQ